MNLKQHKPNPFFPIIIFLLFSFLFFAPTTSLSQAPTLDWAKLSWAPNRPSTGVGNIITNPGAPQSQGASRDEWWHAMTPIYAGGVLDGYATVGYVSWWEDHSQVPKTKWFSTDTLYTDSSQFRQAIAIFELNGTLRWCKPYLTGRLFGVIQDQDENIVATGWAWSQSGIFNSLGNNPVYNVNFNPVAGSSPSTYNPTATGAHQRQLNVVKINPQGDVIWNNYYSHETIQVNALQTDGRGAGLIETNFGGNHGYRIVGTMVAQNFTGNIDIEQRPVLVDINTNGELPTSVSANVTLLNDPAFFPSGYYQIRGLAIQKNSSGTSDDHAITGFYRAPRANPNRKYTSAFMMHFDGSGTVTPAHFIDLNDSSNPLYTHLDNTYPEFATRHNAGFDISIIDDAGTLKFIWSIVDQYEQGTRNSWQVSIFNGAKIGNLDILAFHFDQGGNTMMDWATDLGPVQAYDITARSHISQLDGNVLIGSTKMSPFGAPDSTDLVFKAAFPNFFGPGSFAQSCLVQHYTQFNDCTWPIPYPINWLNPPTGDYWRENPYNWFNTDAYAAKIETSTGTILWETQFDYDDDSDPTNDWLCPTNPGIDTLTSTWDLQNKECIFDIIEDPLGGVLMCGNTSHNYDDGYVLRLYDNCTDNLVTLQLDLEGNAADISWEIIPDSGGAAVCSGSGYLPNTTISPTCCLPDGCYQLNVYINNGTGVCPSCPSLSEDHGYTLFDINGNRIIDNAVDGDGSSDYLSSVNVSSGKDFCLPLGSTDMDINADSYDNNNFDRYGIIRAEENLSVSAEYGMMNQADDGYRFWIFDPDGGYSRRIFQSFDNPGYAGPSDEHGPRNLSVHFWNNLMPPANTLLNVRVSPVVNGTPGNYGPVSRITFSDHCCTKLYDYPQENPYYSVGSQNMKLSCGKTFNWDSSTSGANMRIWAFPRRSQNGCNNINYRWRFTEVGNAGNVLYKNTGAAYHMVLTSVQGMLPPAGTSITWEVAVGTRVGTSGAWDFCGESCDVTINNINPPIYPISDGSIELISDAFLSIWPNPNNGEILNIMLPEETGETERSAQMTIFNIAGQKVYTRNMTFEGNNPVQIDLDNYLKPGVYIIQLKNATTRSSARLIVID